LFGPTLLDRASANHSVFLMRYILSYLFVALLSFNFTTKSAFCAPTALPATDVSDSSFKANWELAENAISHRLDVSIDDSFETFVPEYEDLNVGNATTWLVDGLSSGVSYFYRIRALHSEGDPTLSNVVSVSTDVVPGQQKWVFDTGSAGIGRLALTDEGAIVFAAKDGYLYSVDSDMGTLNWRTELGLDSTVQPSIGANGTIFVSGYALNAQTGVIKWDNGLSGDDISIGPDDTLILNTGDSIRAVNAESGDTLWAFNQAFDLLGTSISEQLLVYFAGTQSGAGNARVHKIFAVDYFSGNLVWDYQLESTKE